MVKATLKRCVPVVRGSRWRRIPDGCGCPQAPSCSRAAAQTAVGLVSWLRRAVPPRPPRAPRPATGDKTSAPRRPGSWRSPCMCRSLRWTPRECPGSLCPRSPISAKRHRNCRFTTRTPKWHKTVAMATQVAQQPEVHTICTSRQYISKSQTSINV